MNAGAALAVGTALGQLAFYIVAFSRRPYRIGWGLLAHLLVVAPFALAVGTGWVA